MKKYAYLLLLSLIACNNPEEHVAAGKSGYFAVKTYFQQEAARLQRLDPVIEKTVVVNGKAETKKLKITSWTKEFASFIDADINKRAWNGEFKKDNTDSVEDYQSNNEKVPVKSVTIYKKDQQISGVVIVVKNQNYLYTSTDTLSYFPGRRYQVRKSQQIKLMNTKEYWITGIF
jgi:hypothetical protein